MNVHNRVYHILVNGKRIGLTHTVEAKSTSYINQSQLNRKQELINQNRMQKDDAICFLFAYCYS